VNAIDGPTEYSAYPSNVSAKLPPKDPEKVATALRKAIAAALPDTAAKNFGGVVVIDSNDLGREILGQDTDRPDDFFKKLFIDNPFGQGRQQTPIALALQA
jgi:asparagine synthase (glutamine-hydrolysing)